MITLNFGHKNTRGICQMSTNQLLALVLLFVYATIHKTMQVVNFSDPIYLVKLAITSVITIIICFKLIK
jgi:hypothetical protein